MTKTAVHERLARGMNRELPAEVQLRMGATRAARATTEALVAAMILIIAVDVFVTRLLIVALGSSCCRQRVFVPQYSRQITD